MMQARGWSAAIQAFKNNDNIVFGDVDMSEQESTIAAIEGTMNPLEPPPWAESQIGKDGWPTIRYYNEETGSPGTGYIVQNEELEPSVELTDLETLMAWIEKSSGSKACDVKTAKGCGKKDTKYIKKWASGKTLEQYVKQAEMLDKQLRSKLSKEASAAIKVRKMLLAQMRHNAFPTEGML